MNPRKAPPSSLFPVRIDVTSDDKTVRIVETLLIDRNCWPIPLYAPLSESLERNIQGYAHDVLSEMEVLGMGRTVRHFTGRVDLYSAKLQTKIEEQLRPQLWAIVSGNLPEPKDPVQVKIRLVIHGVVIQEDILWDPKVPVSPVDFAQDLAKEWNLPDEAEVAITTTMLEQIYGMPMDPAPDRSSSSQKGAWRMDPKEHVATVAQLVAHHRPPT